VDFFGFLSVKEPADMKWFRTEDVEGYLFSPNADPGPFQNRLFAKRLTSIFEYTKHKDLDLNVTMDNIHDTLKIASSPSSLPTSTSPSDSFAKKTVPDLSSFTGAAEDFFRWKEDTQNTLGQAGLRSFLTDATIQSTHKIVAESVFYALKKALTGGNAKHKATALADKDQFSPSVLWSELITHYDTPLNRANAILYEIRRIFNLRLDASTQPDKFLEEFTNCLNRLTKNKAQLASDKDTLRALLLMAIQDREFDNVRNKIVSDPALDWDDILHEIRVRDASMMVQDGPDDHNLHGDGLGTSRASRQANARDKGTSNDSHKKGSGRFTTWQIPTFPPSWKDCFNPKLFQLMCDWRKMANNSTIGPNVLAKKFTLTSDVYTPKNRRGTKKSPDSASDTGSQPGDSVTEDGTQNKRKRISLIDARGVRRTVTETPAPWLTLEDTPRGTARRVVRHDHQISIADSDQPILIAHSGCDQALLCAPWRIIQRTGRFVQMNGAFAGRSDGDTFPVVSATAKLFDEDGNSYMAIIHEALYDSNPAQRESLVSPHQVQRGTQNIMDNKARCEFDMRGLPGTQSSRFGSHEPTFYVTMALTPSPQRTGRHCHESYWPTVVEAYHSSPSSTIQRSYDHPSYYRLEIYSGFYPGPCRL